MDEAERKKEQMQQRPSVTHKSAVDREDLLAKMYWADFSNTRDPGVKRLFSCGR